MKLGLILFLVFDLGRLGRTLGEGRTRRCQLEFKR